MAVKRTRGRPRRPPSTVVRVRATTAAKFRSLTKATGETTADFLEREDVQAKLDELIELAKKIPRPDPKRSKRARATKRSRGGPMFLSRAIAADDLPNEFLLFKPGWNDSTKGAVLFDERAAEKVMAAYREHGTDLMIDLEHQSLLSLEDAAMARADACDARGWFALDLRPDGSLWAVVKSWTPDGERRLREKTQRYISPAFLTDDEGRVVEIINCAIVAMPSTHEAEALV